MKYFVLLLAAVLLLTACGGSSQSNEQQTTETATQEDEPPKEADTSTPSVPEEPQQTEPACDSKCTLKTVTVATSDGETLPLVQGKGSYTAAGAIEWKIGEANKSCTNEEMAVPIDITKNQYGSKVSEETILLKNGEKSKVIRHPNIASIAFTLEVKDLTTTCE